MSTPTWRGRLGLMGLLVVALLGAATPAQATGGPAVPVKIVAPQPYQPGFSIMSGFMDVNGTIFFAAQDDTHGEELWKSDGTTAGTVLVKDVQPGAGSSSPSQLTSFNGKLLFSADDGSHGQELWMSDGTAAGTLLVKDILIGVASAITSTPTIVVSGGRAFFVADDGSHGRQLWVSDGTPVGTQLLKTINIPTPGPFGYWPTNLTNVSGTLFFTTSDQGSSSDTLWKSDGTTAGTVAVKVLPPGFFESSMVQHLTAVGQKLFFIVWVDLWVSDGTSAGTIKLMDRIGDSAFTSTAFDGAFIWTANPNQIGTSDGSVTGTVILKQFATGTTVTALLSTVGKTIFFDTHDSAGTNLWTSDGTATGTVLVTTFAGTIDYPFSDEGISIAGRLVFSTCGYAAGCQLWRSDGSATGTVPLTSQPYQPTTVAARTYIQAENYDLGGEGVAYHTSDTVNRGGTYRPTEGVGLTTGNIDGSSGIILGWTKPGEWLNYTVDIARTRAYTLEVALAAPGVGGSFHVTLDGADVSGPVAVPDTGSWNTWTTISGPALHLPSGRHTLRLVFDSANPTGYVANIDYFVLDGSTNSLNLPLVRR